MQLVHRPQYHFMPLANWMNDPNGLIQWHGTYHLFYQHHPHGAYWDDMHWGHASSPDLVHWTHLPIALAPTPGGPDKDGVFSGCAVDDDGTPTLVYTGVRPEVQCLAVGDDDLIEWHKDPANPVIPGPPEGLEVTGFRDPYVWREGGAWYMALGSGIQGMGGAVLLYRSPDLHDWTYVGPLFEGDIEETGHNWECPNFIAIGDRHLLVISPQPLRQAHYFLGDYASNRFEPDRHGLLDHGDCYYAPQLFIDEQGRRICFGWLQERRSKAAYVAAGWAGVQSLPRLLTLSPDGELHQSPVPELAALRESHRQLSDLSIDGLVLLPEIEGASLELDLKIDLQEAQSVGLEVRRSLDGDERTTIVYDARQNLLMVDTRRASLDVETEGSLQEAPLVLGDQPLRLRVFVDHSVIEIFANDHICFASRIYPTREDSVGVALRTEGGQARLLSLNAWSMKSIWAEG